MQLQKPLHICFHIFYSEKNAYCGSKVFFSKRRGNMNKKIFFFMLLYAAFLFQVNQFFAKSLVDVEREKVAALEQEKKSWFKMVRKGDSKKIKDFLKKDDPKLYWEDKKGRQAIHLAAHKGHLEIVKSLVENNFDVNVPDNRGLRPLHYAADGGSLEIVKYLVANGAGVDAKDENGYRPIDYAKKEKRQEVINYLSDRMKTKWKRRREARKKKYSAKHKDKAKKQVSR